MPITYEPIATATLSSTSSSIGFSSIPNTYTDLRLVVRGSQSSATYFFVRFNGDSSSSYSSLNLIGNGSAASSTRIVDTSIIYVTDNTISTVANAFFLATIDVFSYAASVNKTCLNTFSGDANGSGSVVSTVGLFRNTSAITQINFQNTGGLLQIGTTATLYGIKNA
jgi:hypothetical protein